MVGKMLSKEQIKEILPHRDPLLLVDSVSELEPGRKIVASFCVRPDWDIFQGHFPGNPVFPGVLTVECMAQASSIMVLAQDKYSGKTPYFIGIDEVSFKAKIKPGDEIEIRSVAVCENEDKMVVSCYAEIWNGDVLSATGKVALAIR